MVKRRVNSTDFIFIDFNARIAEISLAKRGFYELRTFKALTMRLDTNILTVYILPISGARYDKWELVCSGEFADEFRRNGSYMMFCSESNEQGGH